MLYLYLKTGVWYFALFFYPLSILTCELVFLGRQERRNFFWLRFLLAVLFNYLLIFLLPSIPNSYWSIFYFIAVYAVSAILWWFVFKIRFWQLIFYCTAGACLKYIIQAILGIAFCKVQVLGNIVMQSIHVALSFVVCVVLFLIFGKRIVEQQSANLDNKVVILTATLCMILIDVLDQFTDVFQRDVFDKIIFNSYSILGCIFILLFQFSFIARSKLAEDMEKINYMWELDKKRMEMSRQLVDSVNMRWHDMKYMQMGNMGDTTQWKEEAAGGYFPIVSTGNKAVDAVITEKILYANSNQIKFSYTCDGALFDFFESVETYSLLGNLLDNAMEASMRISDMARRVVSLNLDRRNGETHLDVNNYYEGEIVFRNGLPESSKRDKEMHGYGTKSIRRIVEKYGGTVEFRAGNGIFTVEIIF